MRSLCEVIVEEDLIGKEAEFRTIWHRDLLEVAKITGVDKETGLIYFKDETGEFDLLEVEIMYLIAEDILYDNHKNTMHYVFWINIINATLGLLGAIFVCWLLFKIFN